MSPTPIADAAWISVTLDRLFAPLRLAVGLNTAPPEPAPERVYRLREVQSSAVLKVQHDARFVGVGVLLAVASAA